MLEDAIKSHCAYRKTLNGIIEYEGIDKVYKLVQGNKAEVVILVCLHFKIPRQEGLVHESTPEELLTVDGLWGRGSQVSLSVRLWYTGSSEWLCTQECMGSPSSMRCVLSIFGSEIQILRY